MIEIDLENASNGELCDVANQIHKVVRERRLKEQQDRGDFRYIVEYCDDENDQPMRNNPYIQEYNVNELSNEWAAIFSTTTPGEAIDKEIRSVELEIKEFLNQLDALNILKGTLG